MNQNSLANSVVLNLTEETDYIGILDKANLIKTFLQGSTNRIKDFKMFSLYGDWGSGKSTLMRYLEDTLKSDFNTFFFEAWEFEKDENLAFSLLEFMIYEKEENNLEHYIDTINFGKRVFKGIRNSIKLSIPLGPIEFDLGKFNEEFDKPEKLSFYKAKNEFKKSFIEFENKLKTNHGKEFNIVFIDDLDRCEPEQVLNLISAIKLFFTLGQKTIFFCGIDKEAVEAAVKTKYNDVIKSNEYLEKIFDFSFSMPEAYNIQKLVNVYFDNTKYNLNDRNWGINDWITDFLIELEFTNPRKLKKALNKFDVLRTFIQINNKDKYNFPNIDLKSNEEKNIFETFLTLYLIILHEFYPEDFKSFLDFEYKKAHYVNLNPKINTGRTLFDLIERNYSNLSFNRILEILNPNLTSRFYLCISPINIDSISLDDFDFDNENNIRVTNKKIDYLFYNFIKKHKIENILSKNPSYATFNSVKQLIRDFL